MVRDLRQSARGLVPLRERIAKKCDGLGGVPRIAASLSLVGK